MPATTHTPGPLHFDEGDFMDEYEILREIEAAEIAEAMAKVFWSTWILRPCVVALPRVIFRILT
jgi:hypothetical protein